MAYCTVMLNLVYKTSSYDLTFVVADFKCQNILGLEGCLVLGLVNRITAKNIGKYSNLFEGLGKLPGKYTIIADKSVQPVVCPNRKNTDRYERCSDG